MFARFKNWFRHWLGINQGVCHSWISPEGRIEAGFMCECGTIHDLTDMTDLVDSMTRKKKA